MFGSHPPSSKAPQMAISNSLPNRVIAKRILKEVKPFRLQIFCLFGLGLLGTPLTLLNPIPLKLAIDSVLGTKPLPAPLAAILPDGATRTSVVTIAAIALMYLLIALVKQLSDLGFSLLRTYTGERLVLAFRAKLFAHVQQLSLAYHDMAGTADSTYRIQYDAPSIQWIALDAVIPLLTEAFTLV